MSRTWAIGDIHGCSTALGALLDRLLPAPDDAIIVLGDIVDRGPDTRGAIDRLLSLSQQCRLRLIQGNHEEMLLDGLANGPLLSMWLAHGGQPALDSYGGDPGAIPAEHLQFLESAADYIELDDLICVHANLRPGIALAEQTKYWLRWKALDPAEAFSDGSQLVVCGHTPQKNGLPLVLPGWVCIDTNCCRGGWLTALDLDRGEFVQANQQAETRHGQIENWHRPGE